MIYLQQKLIKLGGILSNPSWLYVLLRYGVSAGVEHLKVLKRLPIVNTVVDIGANRGQFALVARRCFSRSKIYSFEPLSDASAVYRKIFSRDENSILYQSAIGHEEKKMKMHVSGRDDSSSLLPITKKQDELFPGTKELSVVDVSVSALSSILPDKLIIKPALLKIDVQGFELEVLCGASDVIHCFDYIYVECSFVELYQGQALAYQVIEWLSSKGFFLWGVYNLIYDKDGCAIQADFLFKR